MLLRPCLLFCAIIVSILLLENYKKILGSTPLFHAQIVTFTLYGGFDIQRNYLRPQNEQSRGKNNIPISLYMKRAFNSRDIFQWPNGSYANLFSESFRPPKITYYFLFSIFRLPKFNTISLPFEWQEIVLNNEKKKDSEREIVWKVERAEKIQSERSAHEGPPTKEMSWFPSREMTIEREIVWKKMREK